MQLLAVTDIFGKTKYFDEIISHISERYSTVETLDPYNGKEFDFSDENEAYEYFQEKVGLKNYSEALYEKLIGKETNKLTLLGFSIGASAIWSLSGKLDLYKNTKAIAFYSSQIRNYLHIDPKIIIDLYFSKSEPSYNVKEVVANLSKNENTNCFETKYFHGFMNKKSVNFNQDGYSKYLKIIKSL